VADRRTVVVKSTTDAFAGFLTTTLTVSSPEAGDAMVRRSQITAPPPNRPILESPESPESLGAPLRTSARRCLVALRREPRD
jgi:hypothetical protein